MVKLYTKCIAHAPNLVTQVIDRSRRSHCTHTFGTQDFIDQLSSTVPFTFPASARSKVTSRLPIVKLNAAR